MRKKYNFFYTCGKFKRNDRHKQNAKFLVKTFFGKKRKIFETIYLFCWKPYYRSVSKLADQVLRYYCKHF